LWWTDGIRIVLAGLFFAWIGAYAGKLITGYRSSTGDLFAPAVALAIAIGRIGCLLTEDPGVPAGGDWGIMLTPAQTAIPGGVAGFGLQPSCAAVGFLGYWKARQGGLVLAYLGLFLAATWVSFGRHRAARRGRGPGCGRDRERCSQ